MEYKLQIFVSNNATHDSERRSISVDQGVNKSNKNFPELIKNNTISDFSEIKSTKINIEEDIYEITGQNNFFKYDTKSFKKYKTKNLTENDQTCNSCRRNCNLI